MTTPPLPDPAAELRPLTLRMIRGPNYWAMRPLARLDLAVGAYDELSTAEVPGTRERLVAALPPLAEHECSVGRPGGFVERMTRGTYAPHVIEHVALALQEMAGHDVGYGRTRAGMADGEYVIVVAYRHAAVGRRALALALSLVTRALAGTLVPDDARAAVDELRALAATPERAEDGPAPAPPLVGAGVTGGDPALRVAAVRVLREAGVADACDVDPATLLHDGLPYRRSRVAVVLDAALADDVPAPYRERDRAERLVTTLFDALAPDGVAVVPRRDGALAAHARERATRVLTFADADALAAPLREAAELALRAARREAA